MSYFNGVRLADHSINAAWPIHIGYILTILSQEVRLSLRRNSLTIKKAGSP